MTSEIERARHFSEQLLRQGLASLCLVGLCFLALPWLGGNDPYGSPILWIVFIALATLTLGLSLYICFESVLFRLFASAADETTGGEAVDAFLAKARLRERPSAPHSLDERVAGTMRLVWLQRMALFAFVLAVAFLGLGARQ